MLRWMVRGIAVIAALGLLTGDACAGNKLATLEKKGKPDLKSAGALAFGPSGVLFVADPQGAAIFALGVEAASPSTIPESLKLQAVDTKVAALLGTSANDILINDMAVQPGTRVVYLSVSRGRGPDAIPVIVTIDGAGKPAELSLDDVQYSKVLLANAPSPGTKSRRGPDPRSESITDLAWVDNQLVVAGLSNEEFASKLRVLAFPFKEADRGASIEIFHGSHGKLETRSPIRTFVPLDVAGEPNLLAAYTCTPLVKVPMAELKAGSKVKGTTVAELGNRNRPLDMIVYKKDGGEFILMANSARGVMKIPTDKIGKQEGINAHVKDKAGVGYETVEGLKGVEQLDKWSDQSALLLVRAGKGLNLETVPLP